MKNDFPPTLTPKPSSPPPATTPADLFRPIQLQRPVFQPFGLAADGEGAGVAQVPGAKVSNLLPFGQVAAALDKEFGVVKGWAGVRRDVKNVDYSPPIR